jgi:hypothetical protein
MTLIGLLVLLLIVGVVLALVPVDPKIRTAIYVVLVVLLILWLLCAFGVVGDFGFYPRTRNVIVPVP